VKLKIQKLTTLFLFVVLIAAPIVSMFSWKCWLKKQEIQGIWKTDFSVDMIKASFSQDQATQRDKKTINNFKTTLFQQVVISDYNLHSVLGRYIKNQQAMSTVSLFFILLALGVTGALLQSDFRLRRRMLISQIILAVFFIVYCFVHLLMYLYAFSSYEGEHIASFPRYIGIVLLGWSIVSVSFLLLVDDKSSRKRTVSRVLLTVIFLVVIFFAPSANKNFFRGKSNILTMRQEVEQSLPDINKNVPLDASIYYIWQNDTSHGKRHWIFNYLMCPRRASPGKAWSFGKPYDEGDRWTKDMPFQAVKAILKEYDYLYIGYADKQFWENYKGLFEDLDFIKYFLNDDLKDNSGNVMRDGSLVSIKQGPADWKGGDVTRAYDGITDFSRDNAYGYTGGSKPADNNGRGLTLTFDRSVALTTLVHWAYDLKFDYVVEYYHAGEWQPVKSNIYSEENPVVVAFNNDYSRSSRQWRWYISNWKNPRTNFYGYELEAYEHVPGGYLDYVKFNQKGALFKIVKKVDGDIVIKKVK